MTELPIQVRVSPDRLEAPGSPVRLDLVLPPEADALRLSIDLYDGSEPSSVDSHLGSWARPANVSKLSIGLDPKASGEERVRIEPGGFASYRLDPPSQDRLPAHVDVHVVLRDPKTEQLVVDRVVPWLRTPAAIEDVRSRQAQLLRAPGYVRRLAAAPVLGKDACVHVVAQDIRAGDAVGNLALDVARWLEQRDVVVRLWAGNCEGFATGLIHEVGGLVESVRPQDLVFYHHSIGDPHLGTALAAPCAKLCFYHGVTPPELLAASDPCTAESCRVGLAQLPRLAGFDGLLAASAFTAAQLRDAIGDTKAVHRCPPVLNLDRFREMPAEPVALPKTERMLLCVGRLAPHKRILELLEAFFAYGRLDPECALVLAGSHVDVYGDALKERIARDGADRVRVVERPSDGQLATLYQACTAYVSMSEHEGFGIPLVEAMGFGKPVLACEGTAVRETLGGAGLFERGEPQEVAASWQRILGDPGERERVLAAQAERLRELRRAADGGALAEAMERATRTARTS